MKRWITWTAAGLVVVLLGLGVWRTMAARQAQQKALAEASTQREAAPLQLAADEVITVQAHSLALGVPVSGALRAVDSAMIKARVAGELQGLTLREGDSVRAGQVVARIDPTESQARLRQAQQQADAAKAQVDINQRQLDNNKALVDQGFISQTALQNAMASLNGAKATHMAAVAALDVARKALDDATLRSPISGQIAQRLAQPGERMALDARIVEVVNLTQLELEAALPAADAGLVRQGMKAQLKIEGQDEAVTAQVLRINPAAQAASRSVLVYLSVPGQEGLRQGLFAEGLLGTRSARALAVPLSSVRTDKPLPYVQVVDGDRVRHVSVQTGTRTEKTQQNITLTWVEVKGLSEGTQVLMHQLFYNLINNALKFAKLDNETLITIESTIIGANDKKMAKIIITDNGIGLDPDYVHKIFDVFSRLNAKDEYEGTGLGLALCKKIVQRHHGTIQATGVKGESAIFTILLPVVQVQRIVRQSLTTNHSSSILTIPPSILSTCKR